MRIGRWIMGVAYIAAGIAHFIALPLYASIVPDYLPAHRVLVLISGAAEITGGTGVLLPQTRRPAAWGLVLLLLAVFPANLWMAQQAQRFLIPPWVLWLRLPLQLPLLWWAWSYTRPQSIEAAKIEA